MRVAYDVAPLMNPRTGIGHYAASLLDELMNRGDVTFDLFAVTRNKDDGAVPRRPSDSFKHVRLPARMVVTAWELIGRPTADEWFPRADVVHGTNFWVPPISGRRSIVTLHDLTFWFFPELCTPQIQRYKWIVPKVLERCGGVITPSRVVADEVHSVFGFPSERLHVVPEGVRGAFTGAEPDPKLRDRLGIRGRYLLFAGTQEPRKNLDRTIQAFARLGLDDVQLVLAGPQGWGSVDLPALIHKLKLDGKVIVSGYLPDPELASLMVAADAFVFPTLYEGFGLPPLEAMAAGVPVVASRAGSLPEVLADAAFWCDPTDTDSIAGAMLSVLTDDAAREEAIRLGHARARLFDWAVTATKTFEAYQTVAEG